MKSLEGLVKESSGFSIFVWTEIPYIVLRGYPVHAGIDLRGRPDAGV